jgi:hypothetical protein
MNDMATVSFCDRDAPYSEDVTDRLLHTLRKRRDHLYAVFLIQV